MESEKYTKKRKFKDSNGTKEKPTKPAAVAAAPAPKSKKLKRTDPEPQSEPEIPSAPESSDEEDEEEDDAEESAGFEAEPSKDISDQNEELNGGNGSDADLDGDGDGTNAGDRELSSLVATADGAEKFTELNLSEKTLKAIQEDMKFENMTPIQRRAIPPLRKCFQGVVLL